MHLLCYVLASQCEKEVKEMAGQLDVPLYVLHSKDDPWNPLKVRIACATSVSTKTTTVQIHISTCVMF